MKEAESPGSHVIPPQPRNTGAICHPCLPKPGKPGALAYGAPVIADIAVMGRTQA
jgi:hypothetical protein